MSEEDIVCFTLERVYGQILFRYNKARNILGIEVTTDERYIFTPTPEELDGIKEVLNEQR